MTIRDRIKQFWRQEEKRFLSKEDRHAAPLKYWRARIIFILYFAAVSLGPVALIPSLILSVIERLWIIVILDIIVYSIVVFAYFKRNISTRTRTWAAVLIFYALGVVLIFVLGPKGAGYIWLFGASVMAGAMLGIHSGLFSLMMNLIAMTVAGVYVHFASPAWSLHMENASTAWLVVSTNFLLVNALITITVSIIFDGLKQSLQQEQKTNEHLQEGRRQLRTIFEANPNPILIYSDEGVAIRINTAFKRLMGFTLQDLNQDKTDFGQTIRGILAEQNTKIAQSDQRKPSQVEMDLLNKTGKRIHAILTVAPIGYMNDGKDAFVVNMTDRSTEKLLTDQLQQSRKMEALGTLTGGVAHDFNNLLQIISGYTELLLINKKLESRDFKSIKVIQESGHKAASLVEQLLLFSRSAPSTKLSVSVKNIVSGSLELLERTIPKMVEIEVRTKNPIRPIYGDPIQLEQIFLNLASNASDAMPNGGKITIKISETTLDGGTVGDILDFPAGTYVLIQFIDRGTGIEKEVIEKIFDPFFTTKEIGKGTGLGLASVYGIVKAHNGYITCDSQLNRGTEFKIYFPTIDYSDVDVSGSNIHHEAELKGSEGILIVDDEADIRELTAGQFSDFGYPVLTADSGEAALKRFRENRHRINLVIMDLGMPGMGGKKCVEELRKIDPGLKIIIASGYANDESFSNEPLYQPTAYLAKPYKIKNLIQLTRQILSK